MSTEALGGSMGSTASAVSNVSFWPSPAFSFLGDVWITFISGVVPFWNVLARCERVKGSMVVSWTAGRGKDLEVRSVPGRGSVL